MRYSVFVLCGAGLVLSGCNASQRVVPEPTAITLEAALTSVGKGLSEMNQQIRANTKGQFGLLPSEIEVTFNVSAKGTDSADGKLYIESGAGAGDTLRIVKAGAEAGFKTESIAERGNKVTVKFRNILLAPEDSLVRRLKASEIKELFDVLKAADIVLMSPGDLPANPPSKTPEGK